MILIIDSNGRRLCQDGGYPSCVKVYKKKGCAQNKANRVKGKVILVSEMDAAGNILA